MSFATPSRLAAVVTAAIILSACQKTETGPALTHQICDVSRTGTNALDICKDGDVFAFLPGSWGNEQLPIVAAAQSCDFTRSVVYNNGGVTCVFNGARLRIMAENEHKAAASAPAQNPPAPAK